MFPIIVTHITEKEKSFLIVNILFYITACLTFGNMLKLNKNFLTIRQEKRN